MQTTDTSRDSMSPRNRLDQRRVFFESKALPSRSLLSIAPEANKLPIPKAPRVLPSMQAQCAARATFPHIAKPFAEWTAALLGDIRPHMPSGSEPAVSKPSWSGPVLCRPNLCTRSPVGSQPSNPPHNEARC